MGANQRGHFLGRNAWTMKLPLAGISRFRLWKAFGVFALGVAYGVSPLDLIPDLIPALGLSDDIVVLFLAARIMLNLLRKNRQRNDRGGHPVRLTPPSLA